MSCAKITHISTTCCQTIACGILVTMFSWSCQHWGIVIVCLWCNASSVSDHSLLLSNGGFDVLFNSLFTEYRLEGILAQKNSEKVPWCFIL